MDQHARWALLAGLVFAAVYVLARTFRHRGLRWPATDLLEAVVLLVAPFPLPGAMEMVIKGLGNERLPIFNSSEDRAALIFGVALIVALAYTITATLVKGFAADPAPARQRLRP
jgi:hypothetical protein